MRIAILTVVILATATAVPADETKDRVAKVARTPGLIAFWDFQHAEQGRWTSYHDKNVVERGFPVSLRRIGDPKPYAPHEWPYNDEPSKLRFDDSGPFGHALRLSRGHIFAEVARSEFDGTPLDIHGRQPFTLIAWTRFVGQRHMVAGIWDEGGWDKYGGRRQIALFGGLFGSQGVIAHISTTGAASYPQSTISGSQYARARAIDGHNFPNGQWVALAMTFDPKRRELIAWCNGTATPTQITDPVAQDVFRYPEPVSANPFHFPWPVFSPRAFVLKYNGYHVSTSGVYEHWLEVDAPSGTVAYDRSVAAGAEVRGEYRIQFDVRRDGAALPGAAQTIPAQPKTKRQLPGGVMLQPGDEIVTSLEVRSGDAWSQVGTQIRYRMREGAPFTFGRALGLGNEAITHGSDIDLDGAAVFNRVLLPEELQELSFTGR